MATPRAPHEASTPKSTPRRKKHSWLPDFDPSRTTSPHNRPPVKLAQGIVSPSNKVRDIKIVEEGPATKAVSTAPVVHGGASLSKEAIDKFALQSTLLPSPTRKPISKPKVAAASVYIEKGKETTAPMSRGFASKGSSNLLDSNPSDDICPVCKSNRYLNPKLEFLINPECYHKMCSTCVDRIFTSGPASCPVPYCGKTLRKRGFHKAFFGDLNVEREVDIRKRVGAVFNRRQDEFESLLDWNNYLDDVECLIFDLVQGSKEEKMRAEDKLRQYKEGNMRDIEENRRVGLEAIEMEKRREKAEKEAVRQRRLAALQEAEEEKKDIALSRNQVLEKLANSDGDAARITAQAQKVILKKSSARRNFLDRETEANSAAAMEGLTLRGLKKKVAPVAEKPYDPFGGLVYARTRYVLQENYPDYEALEAAKTVDATSGGWSIKEYTTRCMHEAFAGLGIIIEDENPHKNHPAAEDAAAVAASKLNVESDSKMDIDDVF